MYKLCETCIKMAQHFRWYPDDSESVVPWNATYPFPDQANKCTKTTPRINPKNGGPYNPNDTLRLEFPAQGYVNPSNTVIAFDVDLIITNANNSMVYFQNNIQSLFQRVRLMYGSTPLEDIIDYNFLVRNLTEWTGTQQNCMDNSSISDGIGGVVMGTEGGMAGETFDPRRKGLLNVRKAYIQGYDGTISLFSGPPYLVADIPRNNTGSGRGAVPNGGHATFPPAVSTDITITRRYTVNLALGLFCQEKLIPTKYMASQLAIEIQLEQPAGCIIILPDAVNTTTATYQLRNVVMIPEILEFDASYDAAFAEGLRSNGVPIKISSWHNYKSSTMGSSTFNLNIQERSRSVKSIFTMQRRDPYSFHTDSHASLYATNPDGSYVNNAMVSYQYRIGGKYFPAAPVQGTTSNSGSLVSNGGSEAYNELAKALNIVGDARLSSNVNTQNWAMPPSTGALNYGLATPYNELDYATDLLGFSTTGQPFYSKTAIPDDDNGNTFFGTMPSSAYCMAIDLETSNGLEVSGLNAEEQSDISLQISYLAPQHGSFILSTYVHFDAILMLSPNNVAALIS
jgi:hypothetical protein